LANAFRKEIALSGDVQGDAFKALAAHLANFDLAYGPGEARAGFNVGDGGAGLEAIGAEPKSLSALSSWVRKAVVTGQA
jgi:hypothetical protein